MLIRLSGDAEQSNESDQYPTPIVGSAMHAHTPTSADVHLYADPELFEGRTPLLYADCEGFDGGEKLPIGAVEHRTAATDGDFTFTRLSPGRTRSLKWADRDERRTRYLIHFLGRSRICSTRLKVSKLQSASKATDNPSELSRQPHSVRC
jgi:hypothetical protein